MAWTYRCTDRKIIHFIHRLEKSRIIFFEYIVCVLAQKTYSTLFCCIIILNSPLSVCFKMLCDSISLNLLCPFATRSVNLNAVYMQCHNIC